MKSLAVAASIAGFGCRLVVNNAPYPGLLDFILFQASSTSTLQGSAIVDLNTGDQVEVQMPDYDSQFERIGRADPEQSICLSPAYQILKPQSGFTSGAGSLLASKVGLFLASAEGQPAGVQYNWPCPRLARGWLKWTRKAAELAR